VIDEAPSERRTGIVQTMVDEAGATEATIKQLIQCLLRDGGNDSLIGPAFARVIGESW
jgi:hypothetical protein